MLACVVVAQAVAQGVREPGSRPKAPIMRGPPAQHLPETLNELELRAIAGSSIAFQMRTRSERLRDQGSAMPGGMGDHEHRTRMLGRRIGPSDLPHVPRNARWQGARSRPARLGLRV